MLPPPACVYGCIHYMATQELWEGKDTPFQDITDLDSLIAAVERGDRPPFTDNTPEGVCKVIRNCWADKPEAR